MLKKIPFSIQIFTGLVLGILAGLLLSERQDIAIGYIKPFGDVYLNFIRFIIAPVVFLTVISGIVSMKDVKSFGRTGLKALLFYFLTTAVAVVVGQLTAHLFKPLFPRMQSVGLSYNIQTGMSVSELLLRVFPSNFVGAFSQNEMLQIIVMAIFFGISILSLENKEGAKGVATLEKIVVRLMDIILRFSPLGVFALIVPVIAESGTAVLQSLLLVVICAYVAFFLHLLLVYAPLVYAKKRISVGRFVGQMLPAVAVAFSTASSVSAMTLNLSCCKKLGAGESEADFVIPLGATLNMDGTAIYQGVCVIFIAACFGVNLNISQCVTVALSATLASVGTAGIPGSGMLMLAIALESVGLPVEGVALVAGIDRIFDMGRTAMNVLGDATCAIFVTAKQR